MVDRPVVVLTATRRSPPEMFLLGLCLLTAIGYLVGARPPSSVQAVMPAWLVTGWYVTLGLAGLAGMAGNVWPGQLATGWRLRLAGQLFAAGPAAAYAVAVFAYAGLRAWPVGGLIVAWALFCAWQAGLLIRGLRWLGGLR